MKHDEYLAEFERHITEQPELAASCLLEAFEKLGPEQSFDIPETNPEET